jgi:hypothetical protein
MLDMIEPLSALKSAFDAAVTIQDLIDKICGSTYNEALQVMSDVHAERGLALLREATGLRDAARVDKLLLAIGQFEASYGAAKRQTETPRWKTVLSSSTALEAQKRACLISLALVTSYSWRGVDQESVQLRAIAAKAHFANWEKTIRGLIKYHRLMGYAWAGGSSNILTYSNSTHRATYKILTNELDTLLEIVNRVLLIAV